MRWPAACCSASNRSDGCFSKTGDTRRTQEPHHDEPPSSNRNSPWVSQYEHLLGRADLSMIATTPLPFLPNALHTLIHQRHLTPSCGGHAPTAERTVYPTRRFAESLTPRRERPRPIATIMCVINARVLLAGAKPRRTINAIPVAAVRYARAAGAEMTMS